MAKRLKYGFPISIILLVISRYIPSANVFSISLLLISVILMAIAISKEVMKQSSHIKIGIILLFVLLILSIITLFLPVERGYVSPKIFDMQIWSILFLLTFIAISFLIEKIVLYIKIKTKVK